MKRMLSEAKAWREIARRIGEGEWGKEGLCCEVSDLCGYPSYAINGDTRGVMHGRLTDHLGRHCWDVRNWLPFGQPGPRVLAALFLALEAEDDAAQQSPIGGALVEPERTKRMGGK